MLLFHGPDLGHFLKHLGQVMPQKREKGDVHSCGRLSAVPEKRWWGRQWKSVTQSRFGNYLLFPIIHVPHHHGELRIGCICLPLSAVAGIGDVICTWSNCGERTQNGLYIKFSPALKCCSPTLHLAPLGPFKNSWQRNTSGEKRTDNEASAWFSMFLSSQGNFSPEKLSDLPVIRYSAEQQSCCSGVGRGVWSLPHPLSVSSRFPHKMQWPNSNLPVFAKMLSAASKENPTQNSF